MKIIVPTFLWTTILLASIMLFNACSKDEPAPDNPFNDPNLQPPPEDTITIDTITIDPTSLAGLHANIFRPTCANSGCHDGNFEPDFRTIGSTYNTLLNHNAISTDTTVTPAILRVVPYSIDSSMLWYRMNNFLPESSGIMPLESNDSDWQENKDEHLNNIRTWIENGAPNL